MIAYDFQLALASLKRNPGLSALMVLAVALGIAVCAVTFTVYHAMATNPIEWKSDQLYEVTIDSWSPDEPADTDQPDMPPALLTYRDAMAMKDAGIARYNAVMYKSGAVLDAGRTGTKPFAASLRLTTGDFFPMFDVPFQYGGPWGATADRNGDPVVVLSHETNQKAFGGENSVGRTVRIANVEFRVAGVLEAWSPSPKFYDLNNGSFDEAEDAYLPFAFGAAHELPVYGNTNCWKSEKIESARDFLNSECVWVQMWAELPTVAERQRYQAALDNYARAQKAAGRLPRPLNNRLFDVEQWLDFNHVVKKDNKVLVGIALLFLGVCLVNVVGLLLAKFLNGAALTGLRRALGASRRDIVRQHLAEVLLIGTAGGVLGLLLAAAGLAGIRTIYEPNHDAYDRLTSIDPTVVLATLGLSLAAGLVAGLYPAWRIGRTAPAVYLKTQ
ncbi:MAG: ABC transporter permease [Steroidobacteraceae bacterium]